LAAGPQIISNIQQGQPLFADVDPVKVAKYAAIGAAGGAAIGAGGFLLGSSGVGSTIVGAARTLGTTALQVARAAMPALIRKAGKQALEAGVETAVDTAWSGLATGEVKAEEAIINLGGNFISGLAMGKIDKFMGPMDADRLKDLSKLSIVTDILPRMGAGALINSATYMSGEWLKGAFNQTKSPSLVDIGASTGGSGLEAAFSSGLTRAFNKFVPFAGAIGKGIGTAPFALSQFANRPDIQAKVKGKK
jgi:hypothetical protein